jgi:ligand-binding sensor domain-containing protein
MSYQKNILLLLFLFCFALSAEPQTTILYKMGSPYLEIFQGKIGVLEKSQIWDIKAGNEEYVFFASNDALGIYDGVRWEAINSKEALTLRSLFFDARTNTLYCGSVNQFGKWTQNQKGQFQYTPLWVNEEKNVHMEFWRVNSPTNSDYIYAQSHQAILKYNVKNNTTQILKRSDGFRYTHIVEGDLWLQERNTLYKMDSKENLNKVIDVDDRIVHITVRESDKQVILFLEHKGMFILSNDFSKLIPLNNNTNKILSNAKIFAANDNKSGLFLVGTTKNGLYIIDENGDIVRNVGEHNGLPTSTVLSVNIDNYNNIWMGLDAGIATLDTGPKEVFFSPKPSIGNVRSIVPIQNNIYIGTNQGLFKLEDTGKFSTAGR